MTYQHAGRTGLWHIYCDPPPIPIRDYDWHFHHDAYDGPGDQRCGSAGSLEECLLEIRELEDGELGESDA